MRSVNNSTHFYLYIIISLIIHFGILIFMPFGYLYGDEGTNLNLEKEFGFVQFVDYIPEQKAKEAIKKEEIKKAENEKKEILEPEKVIMNNVEDIKDDKNNVHANEKKEVIEEKVEKSEKKRLGENKIENTNLENEIISSKDSDLEIELKTGDEKENVIKDDKLNSSSVKETPPPPPPPPPGSGELVLSFPKPYYPKDLVGEARSGTVELEAFVNLDGVIDRIEISNSSGIEKMDRNAILTIERGWKFKSYKKSYSIIILVEFLMDEKGNSRVNVELGKVKFF
jgi:TonB family protein